MSFSAFGAPDLASYIVKTCPAIWSRSINGTFSMVLAAVLFCFIVARTPPFAPLVLLGIPRLRKYMASNQLKVVLSPSSSFLPQLFSLSHRLYVCNAVSVCNVARPVVVWQLNMLERRVLQLVGMRDLSQVSAHLAPYIKCNSCFLCVLVHSEKSREHASDFCRSVHF